MMMTSAELEYYRQRLLAMTNRLGGDRLQLAEEARQGTGGEAGGGLSNVPVHLGDLGSHAFEEELTLGLLANEEQLDAEIHSALERMDQGAYGHCDVCRHEISRARLQALPYARHCVACARKCQGQTPPSKGAQEMINLVFDRPKGLTNERDSRNDRRRAAGGYAHLDAKM
jgi:RNA polymerase-binding transcription factor DksA